MKDVKIGELSVGELLNAEGKIVKHVQRLFFPKELAILLNEASQTNLNAFSRVSGKRLCNVSYSSPLRSSTQSLSTEQSGLAAVLEMWTQLLMLQNTQLSFQTSIM